MNTRTRAEELNPRAGCGVAGSPVGGGFRELANERSLA